MNIKNFATFLQELNSAQNWDELKQRAEEFKSVLEKNIESFSRQYADLSESLQKPSL